MDWQIINSGKLPGAENMEMDRKLFSDFEKGLISPTLRIYGWHKPCISLGYAQKFEAVPRRDGWDLVKRPTGGGICFHETSEVSYAIVASKADPRVGGTLMESYFKISAIILNALKSAGIAAEINSKFPPHSKIEKFCFAQTREYEITLNAKKIVGSAQRRGKGGFLQQGTILTDQIKLLNPAKLIALLISEFRF